MPTPYPCPIIPCAGEVLVRQMGELKAFGCTGEEHHTDAQVRNAMIFEGELEIAENFEAMLAIEKRLDPVAWIHDRLDEATKPSMEKIHNRVASDYAALPTFATGFVSREAKLINLRGMTTLSGKASSGKSWFALGAALSSAIDGWEVHYVAAEADDVIGRRVSHVYPSGPPERFRLHSAEPGIRVDDIIESIRSWVCTTRTLLVIDSISTLLGLMRYGRSEDKWEAQDKLEMFLMRVRALTQGEVGIINISEANAQGESKGRVIDHRSDVSLNFKALEDSDAKEIRATKAWESGTGLIGRAMVDAKGPGLELIFDGARAYAPNADEGEQF